MNSFSEQFAKIPSRLVQKVNGDTTENGFRHIGGCIADEIQKGIPDFAQRKDIMDFGCGLGRVTSRLVERIPSARLVGFDIDPLMLRWAAVLLENTGVSLTSS